MEGHRTDTCESGIASTLDSNSRNKCKGTRILVCTRASAARGQNNCDDGEGMKGSGEIVGQAVRDEAWSKTRSTMSDHAVVKGRFLQVFL